MKTRVYVPRLLGAAFAKHTFYRFGISVKSKDDG